MRRVLASESGQGEEARMRDLERIAVIDHMSAGGVSRFLLALLDHMARLYPQTTITYFVSQTNIDRDDLLDYFEDVSNVTVVSLDPPHGTPSEPVDRSLAWRAGAAALKRLPFFRRGVLKVWEWVRDDVLAYGAWWKYSLPPEVVRQFDGFDAVYVAWPYYCEPVETSAPIVATFHDFHYKHFPNAYGGHQLELIERQTKSWMAKCRTVVSSTKFIRDEVLKYYGDVAPDVEVVYLAPYGFRQPTAEEIEQSLEKLGVRHPYALFSGGRSGHKNFAAILRAVGILKQQGTPVHLAITGLGSDEIGAEVEAHPEDPVHVMNEIVQQYGLVRGVDYFPLGYVPNEEVDALTAGADVVVSASLYEAGCGPANDAWQAGAPVAFSNIPQFLEQLDRFGVEAWVFDPHDPADVADKIRSAVFDSEATTRMAEHSRHAFDSYTWDDVAREYYRVLAEAAEKGSR